MKAPEFSCPHIARLELWLQDKLTKEEFMNIIEESLDNMHTFHFTDMTEAVQVMKENERRKKEQTKRSTG